MRLCMLIVINGDFDDQWFNLLSCEVETNAFRIEMSKNSI